MPLPSIFLSHGAPSLAFDETVTRTFLTELGPTLGRPSAIVIVSAHWDTREPCTSAAVRPDTIHDFWGFPDALYRLRYPAPGAPDVAARVTELLNQAGLRANSEERGLDHGAWVPLSLLFPAADVPVTQLSIQAARSPAHHARVGAALRPLRDEGVLLIGSGSLTHNLGEARGRGLHAPAAAANTEFVAWMASAIAAHRTADLFEYRRLAPHAAHNHPTDEHLLPLFTALGAGSGGPGRRLHAGHTYGALAMDTYAFD